MRISDWSSDVCSSDLMRLKAIEDAPALDMTPEDMGARIAAAAQKAREGDRAGVQQVQQSQVGAVQALHRIIGTAHTREQQREQIRWGIHGGRSDERRVGKE